VSHAPASSGIPDPLAATKGTLVTAARILVSHSILDPFGHVSARHPADPHLFLLPIRVAPALIGQEDVRTFTMDGEPADPDGAPLFIERYIHSEIYAARPDVQAIVHSHSPQAIAFSVASQPLRPLCHTCGFLGAHVPLFEMRDFAGADSDLLIRDRQLGAALAASLADHAVVLMRGHGSTAVGGSIGQAVYRAIYTETNARIQAAASALGPVTFLTGAEAEAAERTADLQVERCWEVWSRQAAQSTP
jgi:HCOMODA/2-hydroxy-3-carboxy-muconic semialdehyde decarboxylase